MMQNDITTLVAQVGFPMAIAIYMLGRTDKRLDTLTRAITDLNHAIRDSLPADRAGQRDRQGN